MISSTGHHSPVKTLQRFGILVTQPQGPGALHDWKLWLYSVFSSGISAERPSAQDMDIKLLAVKNQENPGWGDTREIGDQSICFYG